MVNFLDDQLANITGSTVQLHVQLRTVYLHVHVHEHVHVHVQLSVS